MHTRPILSRRETNHSKVPGLDRFGDVVSAHLVPTNQVLWRNQDPAVGARSATGPAGQAVEVFGHRLGIMARGM
jgi:hypothetical protein